MTSKKGNGSGSKKSEVTPAIADMRWRGMLVREVQLREHWHRRWEELLSPEFRPPFHHVCTWKDQFDIKKQCLKLYKTEPSPPIPSKTSEIIGWRSQDPKKSLNKFPTKEGKPPKIRFVKELYGYYRTRPNQCIIERVADGGGQTSVPTRRVQHSVTPLLC